MCAQRRSGEGIAPQQNASPSRENGAASEGRAPFRTGDQPQGVKFTLNAAFFQEIKDDHQQLHCVLDSLKVLVNNRHSIDNHQREFSMLLADLLDQLAFHFTLEEAYGYFEDAIESAPRFHNQAGRLRSQHTQLYLMCQEICEAAASRVHVGAGDMQTVVEQYLAFSKALQAHESAELCLIMDAMNLDIGVGD